ncbi:MAG TPA: transcription antitermination factor NusB, partial [Acidimicrobiales bacterium]
RQVVPPIPYAATLVAGVGEHLDELDQHVEAAARGWTLERMPALDRAVLRLATFELAYRPDVPTGAIIDEAVELAKRYSTEDSGRFVNGVLATVARRLRPSG